MLPRRPLSLPITLAVVMILLLVVLTVGWVLLNIFGALANTRFAGVYWALLSIGTTFTLLLVAGVVMYLALTIKAINLTRRQSNFVDSVTHELKSPIASLKLCLQTLSRRQMSGQEAASFYRYMLEDVERLDHLINQVLDAGRVDSQPVDGEVEEIALEPLLRECAEMVCLRYRVPNHTVVLRVQPSRVRGRRTDVDMVFRNLLDNAVKYAGTPPEVEVSVEVEQGNVVVARVADNGRGIPPRLRRSIFGRFVRIGSELEREKPGTGLGLFIVRNLVRRMRGSVRALDRPGGSGALFEVRLPGTALSPGPDSHLPPATAPPSPPLAVPAD